MIESIYSDYSYSTTASDVTIVNGEQVLGQDEFLELLITQMSNQDPLEPVEDTDFIAQMAQFSALEQQSQLNTSITEFLTRQENSQLYDYLGKEVQINTTAGLVSGIVTEIKNVGDEATVVVNGFEYNPLFIESVGLSEVEVDFLKSE